MSLRNHTVIQSPGMWLLMGLALGSLFSSSQEVAVAQRIVTASGVRLRAAPNAAAEELLRLPLGAVVTQLETSEDGQWFRVAGPDARVGWVHATLTVPFDSNGSVTAYRRIAQSRLDRDSTSFVERADLVRFLDRVMTKIDKTALPEFELLRLRALDQSIRAVRSHDPRDPAEREWVIRHANSLAYSEPAGEWLIRAESIWQLESRYRGQVMADEIAWQAAETGLPGECEGFVICYLGVLKKTYGRYIELYPSGSHLEEALDRIDYLLVEALKPERPFQWVPSEGSQLRQLIDGFTPILQQTSNSRREPMIRRLNQLQEVYR